MGKGDEEREGEGGGGGETEGEGPIRLHCIEAQHTVIAELAIVHTLQD